MNNENATEKELYLNDPQQLVYLINAPVTICIWGRGTGKSEGVIATLVIDKLFRMPRSKGIIIGPTFQHLLVNTLPPVIEMWKRMGYHRDVHYIIGRKPPKSWGWPDPFNSPLSPKHGIFWFNGSCQVLVSQDRVSNSAGPSVDYIIGDEAKHLNHEKLQETFQTNRGNRQYFNNQSCHHSIVFCTDMPTSPKSGWIFSYESDMDEDDIKLCKILIKKQLQLKDQLPDASKTKKVAINRKIAKYEEALEYIRKGGESEESMVYFSEFSSLENLRVLGPAFIREQKRNLPPLKYRASILNERVKKEEGMFYPMLDEDTHYYTKFRYQKIDQIGFDFTKLVKHDYDQDGDVDPDEALDITLDYNAKINNLVVCQGADAINHLFVKSPLMLKDVVKKFCKYYKDHPTKEVVYRYDHTAIGSNAMLGDYTFADQVIDILHEEGWDVIDIYTGQAPGYDSRYEMINNALRGCADLPMPKFNSHNCEHLLISMENTMTRQGPSGFEIDKRSERDDNILPEHATHAQEAWSSWYYSKYGEQWNTSTGSFDEAEMI